MPGVILQSFFNCPSWDDSPLYSDWVAAVIEHGTAVRVEVYGPNLALLGVRGPDASPFMLERAWDGELNTILLDHGVRAIDFANEARRFAFMLRDDFHDMACQVGDGRVNTTLADVLGDSDFADKVPEIGRIVASCREGGIAGPPGDDESGAAGYQAGRRHCLAVLANRAKLLLSPLDYPYDDSKAIFLAAIGVYLDYRFHFS